MSLLLLFKSSGAAPTTGQVKVYISGSWQTKPVKVWDGASWVTKPVKYWDGATWVESTS